MEFLVLGVSDNSAMLEEFMPRVPMSYALLALPSPIIIGWRVVLGLRTTGCVCNLQIKKQNIYA